MTTSRMRRLLPRVVSRNGTLPTTTPAYTSLHSIYTKNISFIFICKMDKNLLLENLRSIPDWPKPGINFRDVTSLFEKPECLREMCEGICELYKDKHITKVVGVESRGFVLTSAVALKLGAGVVLCRKPGKLPGDTVSERYAKEYGEDSLELHTDSINENDVVLLHDDILATGGTMKAVCNLVKRFKPKKVYCNFLIEIDEDFLGGRVPFDDDVEVTSLLSV